MQTADYSRIPLRNRKGEVVAHAKVDPDLAEWLNRWRWHRCAGYATCCGIAMHRLILGLEPGDGRQSDHINRDRLDNRRSNLRIVTQAQNLQNRRSQRGSSSRFRGVSWNARDRNWRAQVWLDGHYHHLGYFEDELEAAGAVSAWRAAHMPYAVEG